MDHRTLMLRRLACGIPFVLGAAFSYAIGAVPGVVAVDLIGGCLGVASALALTWRTD